MLLCEGPGQHPACLGQAAAHAWARICCTSHRELCFGLHAGFTHRMRSRARTGAANAQAEAGTCSRQSRSQQMHAAHMLMRASQSSIMLAAQWRHWCRLCLTTEPPQAGAKSLGMCRHDCRESSWHSRWAAAALVGGWQGSLLVSEAALEACCCI